MTDGVERRIAGATVTLGSRTPTTDGAGFYSFTVAAGRHVSDDRRPRSPATRRRRSPSIAVTDGGDDRRDFALTTAPTSGLPHRHDAGRLPARRPHEHATLTASPGDVILLDADKIDQQNLTVTSSGFGINATTWAGQTFTPAVTGRVTRIDLDLFCSGCTGTTPNLTVSIRATSGSPALPTGADLATATIPGFNSGAGGFFSAIFASPVTLTAGTSYAVIVRPVTNPTAGIYAYVCSCAGTGTVNSNPYANGQRVTSGNSGGTWTADTTVGGRDLGFKVFVKTGFPLTGEAMCRRRRTRIPAAAASPPGARLRGRRRRPSGTSLTFQAAASTAPDGPFNFVGPDGTAATFFNSGDSLAQFNGKRYLKYRAVLGTTNASVTPTLSDVTICFANRVVTSLSLAAASATYGGTTTLSATLSGGAAVAGKPIAFSVNGSAAGTASTDAAGVATLAGVDVSSLDAGTFPIAASFAGDAGLTAAGASNTLTIAKGAQAIAFGPLPDRVATDPPFTVSATGGGSGNPVTFSTSSTACSVSGTTVTLLSAGSCAIDADQAGSTNYEAAPRVTRTFTVSAAGQTITFAPIPPHTLGDADFTVAPTASSGLPVSLTAAGSCTVSGDVVHLTGVGLCALTATQGGSAQYAAAPPVARSFPVLFATGECLGEPAHQVLPPLDNDGSSVKNQGSTIPVKFRVCDVRGVSIGNPDVVTSFRLVQIITGAATANVDATPASTNGDTEFRWDPTAREWIFNLSTRPLAAGSTYVYRIALADGTAIEFRFALR